MHLYVHTYINEVEERPFPYYEILNKYSKNEDLKILFFTNTIIVD